MNLMRLQPFSARWQHSACGYVFPTCPFGFPASLGHLARSAPLTGKFGVPNIFQVYLGVIPTLCTRMCPLDLSE